MKKIRTLIALMFMFAASKAQQRDSLFVETGKDGYFLVFPNPSPSGIIKVNCSYLKCVNIKVYDMAGKEAAIKTCVDVYSGMVEIEIDPQVATSGRDLTVVTTQGNKVYAEKLFIRK